MCWKNRTKILRMKMNTNTRGWRKHIKLALKQLKSLSTNGSWRTWMKTTKTKNRQETSLSTRANCVKEVQVGYRSFNESTEIFKRGRTICLKSSWCSWKICWHNERAQGSTRKLSRPASRSKSNANFSANQMAASLIINRSMK